MVEIQFQRIEDAQSFYQLLQESLLSSQSDEIILHDEDRNIVTIKTEGFSDKEFCGLREVFFHYMLYVKCEQWFRDIITEQFYFSEEEEIRQILEIIYSILEGDRQDIASFLKHEDCGIQEILVNAINHIIARSISFSFDSFVKFGLKPLKDKLEKYVEISIDEYKMEQEYQVFIHTLRDFISCRAPKVACLHLIMDEDVRFFDEQFIEIKRPELMKMVDRKLLINHPVYVDSTTLAPLLSIAPNSICVYTKDLEQPLIRTIQNIFEERVTVDELDCFVERQNHYYSKIKRIP